jgi:hypothetical protein
VWGGRCALCSIFIAFMFCWKICNSSFMRISLQTQNSRNQLRMFRCKPYYMQNRQWEKYTHKKNSVVFSPLANYTDRAITANQRS